MSSRRIGENSAGTGLGQGFEPTYNRDQLPPETQDRGILVQRIRRSEIPLEEDHLTGGNYHHTLGYREVASGKPHSHPPIPQKCYDSNINEAQATAAYTPLRSELDPGTSVELRDLPVPQLHNLGRWEEQLTPNSSSAQSSQGGLISALLRKMMATLLRSPPAAGASSYGALPTIPIDSECASPLERESVSDEEIGLGNDGIHDHAEQGQDRLYSEPNEQCVVGAVPKMRKRSVVMRAEMLGPSRPLGEGLGENLAISVGPGLGPEVTEEDDQYDENDPPDNSPYVNPL